jgi:1,4-dihydroxy-2-naphthoyl-CoA hydrolase
MFEVIDSATGSGDASLIPRKDREQLDRLLDAMPFALALGIKLSVATPDRVVGRLAWAPERCTTGGMLHGGVLMAIADSLGGLCAYLNLPSDAGTATISSSINFLRAVRDGEVIGTANPVHVGQSVIVVHTKLKRADGKLVAQVTQAQAVLSSQSAGTHSR